MAIHYISFYTNTKKRRQVSSGISKIEYMLDVLKSLDERVVAVSTASSAETGLQRGFTEGDVLYLPRESKTDVPYNKVFIQSGSGMCIFFDSVSSLCDKPMLFKKCDRSVQMLFQQIYTAYCRSNTLTAVKPRGYHIE